MRIESVRDLKAELLEASATGLRPQDASALSVPAGRPAGSASVVPGVALGVVPSRNTQGFRLAVRLQRRELVDGFRVDSITQAARGEVDISYVGRLTKQAGAKPAASQTLRPGMSVGHVDITAGTLGGLVKVAGDSRPHVLSNNHVLAVENAATVGDCIVQPGPLDGGTEPDDVIGRLSNFVPLKAGVANKVDAAVAVLDDGIPAENQIDGFGNINGISEVDFLEDVVKFGRTTARTHGRVTAIEMDNVVVGFSMGDLRFDGQLEITGEPSLPFSAGGDSGSLVLGSASQSAVALLFAGTDEGGPAGPGRTYATPVQSVFDELDIGGFWP